MSITSKEISTICGVSRGTVYRALHNKPGINDETRKNILKVADELGYRPNFIAQSLVLSKTMTIGVVLFDVRNPIFSQIIHSIEAHARQNEYFVYLTITNKDPELEKRSLQSLVDRKVDGIILLSINKGKEYIKFLKKLNTPIVSFGNRIDESIPFIWIDDRKAIQDATEFLIQKKYERVISVNPALSQSHKLNTDSPNQRLLGFIDAIQKHPDINHVMIKQKNYMKMLENYTLLNGQKTAIFCSSDFYVLSIIQHFNKAGITPPKDIGLMGFDNIETLKYITPSIATVGYSVEDIGQSALQILIDQINGKHVPMTTLLPHQIIDGDSLE